MVISEKLTEFDVKKMKSFNNTDFTDCPELTDKQLSELKFKNLPNKIMVSFDSDNMAWLKQNQSDLQKQINHIIRWAREHDCPLEIA